MDNIEKDVTAEEENPSLSKCALKHIAKYKDLSDGMLDKHFQLPCGCEEAPLKLLLNSYACIQCNTKYIYSFCLDEVVTEESTWHCEFCGSC